MTTTWMVRSNDAPRDRLLEHVLDFMINDQLHMSATSLGRALVRGGGVRGEPGWEIDHLPIDGSEGGFRLWADSEMTGVEPKEAFYSVEEVFTRLRERLDARVARLARPCPATEAALGSLPSLRLRFVPQAD